MSSTKQHLMSGVLVSTISERVRDERLTHAELVYIGVKRCYRGHGVGSRLLKQCTDKARHLQLPVIVHAEPAARGFFDHHSLQDFAHGDIDLSQYSPPHSGFGLFRLTGMITEKVKT